MIPPCGVPVLLPLPPVICRFPRSSCCSTGFQPHLDELEHVVVNDTTRHRLHQLMMRDRIEVLRHVRIHHLSVSSTQQSVHFPNRLLLGTAPRSIAVRARLEIRFEDRLQHQLGRALRHSVLYGWYSKWPLAAARFGYHHSAHRTRLIRLFVQRFSRLGVRHVDNVTTPSSILARRCWYDPQAVREESGRAASQGFNYHCLIFSQVQEPSPTGWHFSGINKRVSSHAFRHRQQRIR